MTDSVSVTLELDEPFFEILKQEAERDDKDVEELIKQWCWVRHEEVVWRRYRSDKPTVEVDVPDELYERAKLVSELSGSPPDRMDDWLFNQFGVNIDWVPSE